MLVRVSSPFQEQGDGDKVKVLVIGGTRFIPGKLGDDVDLAYEDEVIAKYG